MRALIASSRFRLLALFAALALTVLLVPIPAGASPTVHTLTLDMHQYAFTPSRVEINHGDLVIINLTASDVVHGFYLDGYDIQQRVEPGITRQISFTADQPGKFRYRCSVSCGSMHPFMIGELVVNANTPLWRAVALLAIGLIGSLTYLWLSGAQDS